MVEKLDLSESKAGENGVHLVTLMGGEASRQWGDWRNHPERNGIIIGSQDMLLSRALNRGYAQSPYQWPIDFALLNNDCLWVLDEVQLMSNGLPTTTQLAAFRQQQNYGAYGPTHTLWMSATIHPEWLHTVDFPAPTAGQILSLDDQDSNHEGLKKRNTAVKTLRQFRCQQNPTGGQPYNPREIAAAIAEKHQDGTLTLAVLNTVAGHRPYSTN
jgi:CRISPR-associated endonuclease/helicase Cas3